MSTTFSTINVTDLRQLTTQGGIEIIDVRTPVEFREVHIQGVSNIPLDMLKPEAVMSGRNADQPLYVVCKSGGRSAKACEAFVAAGFSNVVSIDGGTSAWDAAGYPVNRGKKAISLERQVRIAAGLMAFTGAVLGYAVHPWWHGLSGFVGAGLTFAGITDTCAMGMLIARMPWNRVSDRCSSGA